MPTVMLYRLEAPLSLYLTRIILYRKGDRDAAYIDTGRRMASRQRQPRLFVRPSGIEVGLVKMLDMLRRQRKMSLRDLRSFSKNMKWAKYPG